MAEPFLAEIRIMSFVFAPRGWALCNGQLLPINQNQALFSLLGTTFGGDGRVNFALPDLRARMPIHVGSGHTLGERGGEQAHTLSIAELPTHTHVGMDAARQPTASSTPPAVPLSRATGLATSTRRPQLWSPLMRRVRQQHRRQPGAPQHAAVPDADLLHRAAGHLPVAELRGRSWHNRMSVKSGCSPGNFAPAGWMFCEGQLLPISRKRDALPADRHDLRRRRRDHLRAARSARPRSRSTRATASSWRRPAAPRRSR